MVDSGASKMTFITSQHGRSCCVVCTLAYPWGKEDAITHQSSLVKTRINGIGPFVSRALAVSRAPGLFSGRVFFYDRRGVLPLGALPHF